MTKLRNPKADLLWEATRRNENYKKEYHNELRKFQKKFPDHPKENFKRLPSPDSNRWKIKMGGINPITKKLCSFYWLDPETELNEIWDDVNKRKNLQLHPYNHLFPDERIDKSLWKTLEKNTEIKYEKIILDSYYYNTLHGFEEDGYLRFNNYQRILEPQNISNDLMLEDFFELEVDNTVYVAIKKENIKDKMLVMIDPLEIDESIKIKIQAIKGEIIQSLKNNIQKLKDSGKIFIGPSKIKYCLNWFKIYDIIINNAYEKSSSDVICVDGAKCVNTGKSSILSFGEVALHTNLDKNNYENDEEHGKATDKKIRADKKKSKPAYDTSVELIQQTPNIFFLPKIKLEETNPKS